MSSMSECGCKTCVLVPTYENKTITKCISGFHRRLLPESAIVFSSQKGKQIFKEALLSNGLEGYFTLAETFQTQADPAYCGPGTLTMVLNSLQIDSQQIWKGNWRWYSEDILQTCDKRKPQDNPLENVNENGITFEEFLYLAECNGASVIPFPAMYGSIKQFRSAIITACTRKKDDIRLVVSYDRKTLQQTGGGHFSPIAGYHEKDDLVLILDVARFKYPPHWISVDSLWQSLLQIDSVTMKSRGYYLISRWPMDISVQCVKGSCSSSITPDILSTILCPSEDSLDRYLATVLPSKLTNCSTLDDIFIQIVHTFPVSAVQLFTKFSFDLTQKYRLLATKSDSSQCKSCPNTLVSYSSFIPNSLPETSSLNCDTMNKCKEPCTRVTKSHIHAYAIPPQCSLAPLLKLFSENCLFSLVKRIEIEKYLTINDGTKDFYLFGGLSPMFDSSTNDNEIKKTNINRFVEYALVSIILYAIRPYVFKCLTNENLKNTFELLLNMDNLAIDLITEVDYAKMSLGIK